MTKIFIKPKQYTISNQCQTNEDLMRTKKKGSKVILDYNIMFSILQYAYISTFKTFGFHLIM